MIPLLHGWEATKPPPWRWCVQGSGARMYHGAEWKQGKKGGRNFFFFLLYSVPTPTDRHSMEANLFLILATADAVGCAMYADTLWAVPFGILCVTCAALGLVRAFGE